MTWYEDARFYHVYPLGLLGAEATNDYKEVRHRLKDFKPWLTHIKECNFNALYIGPLFESVGHGYETTDYKLLDRRLGDNKDLKEMVAHAHSLGIRVIFDGVFNHVGRDFFAFKDLLQNRENSRYKDWFCNVNFWGNNEYNDGFCYDNWGGYNLLVKLNQRNPEVIDYILDVIRFWVCEFDVDGIRLDAADVLDFDFMKRLRTLANEVKSEFYLMGEVIHGDYARWVGDSMLNAVTNYQLHKALFSGHNDHNYFEIAHTVKRHFDIMGDGVYKLYNFVDNHDVERIATKLNNKEHFYPVHTLLYTLPGIPSVYYGSEFGIEGRKERGSDASLRPHLSLSDFECDNPYKEFIKKLGEVRANVPALSKGIYKELMLTNRQFAFLRKTQDSEAIVVVNNDENDATIVLRGVANGKYKAMISGMEIEVCEEEMKLEIKKCMGEILEKL